MLPEKHALSGAHKYPKLHLGHVGPRLVVFRPEQSSRGSDVSFSGLIWKELFSPPILEMDPAIA